MAAPIFHMAAGAPSPVAPFSHAVEVDGWICVTGQMPNDAANEAAPLPPDIAPVLRSDTNGQSPIVAGAPGWARLTTVSAARHSARAWASEPASATSNAPRGAAASPRARRGCGASRP